ncbi:hypothetical protein [Aggregatibacter actinomycetemcomitans]|uniref:hypothetical protein n=1 Tax=Aggregatibacter actinomycetemcomitans TaxID=714 RepID=UPI001E312B36|nr:hypothetical protein [Aggregatibacter actinomycetemcomitans]
MNFLALSAKSEVYPDLINLEKVLYIKVRTFNDEGVKPIYSAFKQGLSALNNEF